MARATRGSSWMPMTSPVDCIPGPTDGSTPRSLAVENAGALTATNAGAGSSPPGQPSSRSVAPRAIRTARSTIGTPVTLHRNGTVREARGLTSMRYTPSSRTMNWALTRPRTPSARTIRSIVATIRRGRPARRPAGEHPDRVARVDAGPLDVLEQARDEDVGPVRHGVDVDLDALEVAVDPDRPVGIDDGGHGQLADEIAGAVGEVDRQPADDERRPDDDRVADPIGQRQRLLDAVGHPALGLRDAEPVEQRREPGPFLGLVDGLEIGPEERDPARRPARRRG